MGFLGGLVGLIAGVGLTVIFATVFGSNGMGVENYQPWPAAFRSMQKVLVTGFFGLVASPARNYLESRSRDAVGAMVTWNASMVELSLPAGAETLTLANLQSGQFDAEGMLRFKSLMDDLSANGLVDFAIADRDNVTLFSLDTRNTGTTVPPLDSTEETVARSARA